MDSIHRDRPETRLQFGEERPGVSAGAWWQLGAGVALLLTAGGGISPRTVVRAMAVAGGTVLVYRALAGPEGLLARLGANSGADSDTSGNTGTASSVGQPAASTSTVPSPAAHLPEEEPALAGSDSIPPIDMRSA